MKWDGNRLKYLRTLRGYTQKELATKLSKAKSTVSGYEINNSEPDTDTLVELTKILKTTTDYLLGVSDEYEKRLYYYKELPDIIKEAGIDEIGLLKNCKLDEMTLDELEDLLQVAKKIKNRQDKLKKHPR